MTTNELKLILSDVGNLILNKDERSRMNIAVVSTDGKEDYIKILFEGGETQGEYCVQDGFLVYEKEQANWKDRVYLAIDKIQSIKVHTIS